MPYRALPIALPLKLIQEVQSAVTLIISLGWGGGAAAWLD